jgi:hypothetical protein
MSDGRLYIRCECGGLLCLAGSEALVVWLNAHVIEHAGLSWEPIACGSRFSVVDETEP